jgi:hypothetical membrane protein
MTEQFWGVICEMTPLFRLLLVFVISGMILSVVGVFYLQPPAARYYITIINLFMFISLFIANVWILRRCKNRTTEL